MKHKSLARVLALDLHPRSFSYAVVESPGRLLDWGVRSFRRHGSSADVLARRRLRPLFKLWRPSVVVVQSPSRMIPRIRSRYTKLIQQIALEARSHRIPVRPERKQAQGLTKYENARLVAEQFPVLARNLPQKRKLWESEDYRMGVFSAVSLARELEEAYVRFIPEQE